MGSDFVNEYWQIGSGSGHEYYQIGSSDVNSQKGSGCKNSNPEKHLEQEIILITHYAGKCFPW